jgi:hypothetical protein
LITVAASASHAHMTLLRDVQKELEEHKTELNALKDKEKKQNEEIEEKLQVVQEKIGGKKFKNDMDLDAAIQPFSPTTRHLVHKYNTRFIERNALRFGEENDSFADRLAKLQDL